MNRKVTIVMYHYVRDLVRSRFPALKGLSLDRFCRQLAYIQTHYTPITPEDLSEAASLPENELPPNAILLTFDDGYLDHFVNVFPLLEARGIRACFFPPAQAILEHKVLDVNKIHFILAATTNIDTLLDELFASLAEFRSEYVLKTREAYVSTVPVEHRYDTREVTLFKRLLQRELPERIRAEVLQRLFAKYVTADETAFACELYMSMEQIACLQRHGMRIGSHGYSHAWLNHLAPEGQVCEVDRSLDFLKKLNVRTDEWIMCYPYGGFNDPLLSLLRKRQCRLGFTVEARVADLDAEDRLALPRVDTNDLPS